MLTSEELAALRDLDSKRIAGPYQAAGSAVVATFPEGVGLVTRVQAWREGPETAAYIAAACNALPRALVHIETLDAACDNLKVLLDAQAKEIARLHDERTCLKVDLDEAADMLQTPLRWGAAQTDPDWMARVGRFLERP